VPEARRRTGLVFDERCLAHRNPPGGVAFGALPPWATVEAFERPERLTRTRDVLAGSGALAHVEAVAAREADEDELRLVHTPEHVERVLAAAGTGGPVCLGPDAWTVPGTRAAALVAAGGVLEAVDAVLGARGLDGAVALVRPPGHHAERDAPMGFCLFNNVAVAARWAQRAHGIARVAIVDWDVHHGNGTEEIFYGDGSVLCVSLHQDGLFPAHTGGLEARGEGDGAGANVNVPLPAGTGDDGYLYAFAQVVEPVVRAFRPQLLLIGAGQDAAATDPLGRMSLTVPGFRALADRAVALAAEVCQGRLVVVLEGGYSLLHLPLANLAIVESLAGLPPSFAADPVGVDVPPALRDVERAAVEAAVLAHAVAAP
jgi:acetoin utilization deacetylase AcuC-like enzyme